MRKPTILLLSFSLIASTVCADEYVLGPDSERHPNVPQGKVTKYQWTSKIYPGTVRDYYVYVPAQYKADKPACTMVFQDGWSYANPNGQARLGFVFDNLIHKKELPPIVGVFFLSNFAARSPVRSSS